MIVIYSDETKEYLVKEFLPWLNERDSNIDYYEVSNEAVVNTIHSVLMYYQTPDTVFISAKSLRDMSQNTPVVVLNNSMYILYKDRTLSKNDLGR
ncbi:hypothetical protein FMLHJGGC_00067 [Staphylococcus phage BSwM-KMM1]|nr:hypothetical protein FMLHJGGC_00067 [Pseudomonas phage BSwM KMM1]